MVDVFVLPFYGNPIIPVMLSSWNGTKCSSAVESAPIFSTKIFSLRLLSYEAASLSVCAYCHPATVTVVPSLPPITAIIPGNTMCEIYASRKLISIFHYKLLFGRLLDRSRLDGWLSDDVESGGVNTMFGSNYL